MNKRISMAAMATSTIALGALGVLGAGPAAAHTADDHGPRTQVLRANLTELNDSGASGKATVILKDGEIDRIQVRARGLTPDAPHAQHIHYGEDALNECPTLAQDTNDDGRLNTVEGVPAYGPVALSLTTSGDTSPASVLAVSRYPVAEDGRINYRRSNIAFTDVAGAGAGGTTATADELRAAIAAGEGVVVIHGIDYDGNGSYSLSKEGASELDPSLPAEATDPSVCGLLR
jgi:hypothetical protein